MDPISAASAPSSLNQHEIAKPSGTASDNGGNQSSGFVAIGSPSASLDSLRSVFASLQSISPNADPVSGRLSGAPVADDSKPGHLTDVSSLPADLRHALAAFRAAAFEAIVPSAVVSVTSGAASSIKRIHQGQ